MEIDVINRTGRILVVDDEASVRLAFQDMLESRGYEVNVISRADKCLEEIDQLCPDIVIMDVFMPGLNGLAALEIMRKKNGRLPVIIMTGKGTMETAIEATKLGAFDYQLKPFEPSVMLEIIERALESAFLMKKPIQLGEEKKIESLSHDVIVGKSPAMQEVFKIIGRVARTDATVLIRGESGTGKELVARAIYQHSSRAERNLVVVNCAALPSNLIESELFGYERGAFTGANARRIGKFEQANGGTIFLDEIGELPIDTQSKLLRVLQAKTIERLGGQETIQLDVRVIAATNRPLENAIKSGAFREDLYHRLNVVELNLPPLRQRKGDVPNLISFFANKFSNEMGSTLPIFSPEAMLRFEGYEWPGNVRQLEHCIHRLVIFTQGQAIGEAAVKQALMVDDECEKSQVSAPDGFELGKYISTYLELYRGDNAFVEMVELVEQLLLNHAMRDAKKNQSAAARLLGLNRTTLQAKLKRYDLES